MATDGVHGKSLARIRRWRVHAVLVLLGCAIAFFGYRSYRAVERDLSDAALSGRTAISVLAASTLAQDFQRLMDVGRALATRVRFGELIRLGRWQEAAQIMSNIPRDFSVEQVLLTDPQGELQSAIAATDASVELPDAAELRAMAAEEPVVSGVQRPTASDASYFMVSLPVRGPDRVVLAHLVLRISTQRFQALFAQLRMERRGFIQVVDGAGRVAFDSAAPNAAMSVDLSDDVLVRRMLRGETGVDLEPSQVADRNGPDVAAFAPTPFGWGVIARWPQRTVFAARDAQLRRVLVACGLFAALVAVAIGLLWQLAVERRQTSSERRANLELESRVRERTAQLEKANVDLESFSYSVSHDLRAPLRAIDGYVHFLSEEHEQLFGASARRCIDNVHRNVAQMSRLIDELLELARVGRIALKQEQVDMAAMVQDVLSGVLVAGSNVAVHVQALPPALADATLMRQIWINLLDNAVKYSSRVAVPQVTVCAQSEPGQVTYCVVDNGVGFDMQHYERLFKPFSRLHSPGEFSGTGVGLALVKRIVERHDGRVWAESIPNQSTKVFFSLPGAAVTG